MSEAEKLCPMKFLMEKDERKIRSDLTCDGSDCAWFVNGRCAVVNISEEIYQQGKSISEQIPNLKGV